MRRILVLGLMVGLGAAAAVAETTGSCSIRAGRTEGKMSFSWERGECEVGHHCHEGDSDMLWSKWSGVTPSDLEHEGAAVDARMKAERIVIAAEAPNVHVVNRWASCLFIVI